MQRFILQQNVARFQRLLGESADEDRQRMLGSLLVSARRKLAVLEAESFGVVTDLARLGVLPAWFNRDSRVARHLKHEFENAPYPCLLLDPRPGLHIVDMTDAYAQATMTARSKVAGERLFEVFPDNPDDIAADGVSKLYASFRTAIETGVPHKMQVQRYDIRDANGRFVVKHWHPVNTPLFDAEKRLIYILHSAEDVTDKVHSTTVPAALFHPSLARGVVLTLELERDR